MDNEARAGRPRSSSKETIAEAACELFLERGYDETSIADIATRAGVSRSTFFNYFGSKADVLWGGFDERMDRACSALVDGSASIPVVLRAMVEDFAPDSLALAVANADTMGIANELGHERAVRQARLADAIAESAHRGGTPGLSAQIHGAAAAAAVLASVWAWAVDGPGATRLAAVFERALADVPPPRGEGVRQLRVVVEAEEFETALAFYRDVLGMPQAEAYEAEGGARVAILAAGRATLELSNSAQVRFIDRVETDGDAPSDHIRVALEVGDAAATAARAVDAGAALQASVRETPWRSLNARLRAPADMQVTLFQELGPDGTAAG
jgi:AcrR family transcriptional regulator